MASVSRSMDIESIAFASAKDLPVRYTGLGQEIVPTHASASRS
jgi:hypothetical protein